MLKLAHDLELPDEAVTQTFGILAKRGVGKTYTANVMTEEMLKANLHVVVIDPIGVWYGLRSSADGKSEGLSIIIAGGEHADIPIAPDSGEKLANLIIEKRLSMVVDISLFRKAEQTKFMTDFAETIYRKNRNALHLMVDEADAFAPQRAMPEQARLLGAMEDLVRRGRARGIGMTMITQRPAVLNKNVLTQIEVLVALRLTAPIDQKAIDEWIKSNAEPDEREEFMSAISSLPVGDAYFWSPGWLKIFKRVHIRKRETLDSSSTPVAGKEVIRPEAMAKVDIDELRRELEQEEKKAEGDSPKALKARIKELEKQLKEVKEPEVVKQLVKVPSIPPEQMAVLHENLPPVIKTLQELYDMSADAMAWPLGKPFGDSSEEFKKMHLGDWDHVDSNSVVYPGPDHPELFKPVRKMQADIVKSIDKAKLGADESVISTPSGEIRGGALRMLQVLVNGWPMRYTKSQMANLAKMKITSGTFKTYWGRLKREGYIVEAADGMLDATDQTFEMLGETRDRKPMTPEEVYNTWAAVLPAGSLRLLDVLMKYYPAATSRSNLAFESGFSEGSGTFKTYLGNLRRNKLITVDNGKVRAADFLGENNGKQA